MRIRTINTMGLYIKQLITKYLVFSYTNNKTAMMGKVGRRFDIQLTKHTNHKLGK